MSRPVSALSVALLGLAAFASATPAAAYCRSHTCDPRTEDCDKDNTGCIISGFPLSWASSCVSFAVQEDGSPRHDISESDFAEIVHDAFQRWLEVDCGDGTTPLMEIVNNGPVECHKVEYNQRDGNANVFMFRDEEWPYEGGEDALGLSTIRFDPGSGRVYDVDVEINGTDTPITTNTPPDGADLASILTHEVGHFLGLSHSRIPGATMRPGYSPGDDSLRTLENDDMDGICAALAPNRNTESHSCTPRHGFSSDCGGTTKDKSCAVTAPGGERDNAAFAFAAVTLFAVALRRRARLA
jgi:hypothetical protein